MITGSSRIQTQKPYNKAIGAENQSPIDQSPYRFAIIENKENITTHDNMAISGILINETALKKLDNSILEHVRKDDFIIFLFNLQQGLFEEAYKYLYTKVNLYLFSKGIKDINQINKMRPNLIDDCFKVIFEANSFKIYFDKSKQNECGDVIEYLLLDLISEKSKITQFCKKYLREMTKLGYKAVMERIERKQSIIKNLYTVGFDVDDRKIQLQTLGSLMEPLKEREKVIERFCREYLLLDKTETVTLNHITESLNDKIKLLENSLQLTTPGEIKLLNLESIIGVLKSIVSGLTNKITDPKSIIKNFNHIIITINKTKKIIITINQTKEIIITINQTKVINLDPSVNVILSDILKELQSKEFYINSVNAILSDILKELQSKEFYIKRLFEDLDSRQILLPTIKNIKKHFKIKEDIIQNFYFKYSLKNKKALWPALEQVLFDLEHEKELLINDEIKVNIQTDVEIKKVVIKELYQKYLLNNLEFSTPSFGAIKEDFENEEAIIREFYLQYFAMCNADSLRCSVSNIRKFIEEEEVIIKTFYENILSSNDKLKNEINDKKEQLKKELAEINSLIAINDKKELKENDLFSKEEQLKKELAEINSLIAINDKKELKENELLSKKEHLQKELAEINSLTLLFSIEIQISNFINKIEKFDPVRHYIYKDEWINMEDQLCNFGINIRNFLELGIDSDQKTQEDINFKTMRFIDNLSDLSSMKISENIQVQREDIEIEKTIFKNICETYSLIDNDNIQVSQSVIKHIISSLSERKLELEFIENIIKNINGDILNNFKDYLIMLNNKEDYDNLGGGDCTVL